VAAELRRLRDRNDAAGAADLLEGLYGAWEYLTGSSGGAARFADIYRLFCLTPGWRKENPKPAFAQAIYALQRANIPMTRKGVAYQFDFPSGNPKESDVFSVVDDIGRNIRYYGITFLPQGR
jgi:hypothetical protein